MLVGDLKEVGGTPRKVPPTPQAQLIAQAIGQAFAVAYSQFLRESGIDPSQVGTEQSQGAMGPRGDAGWRGQWTT